MTHVAIILITFWYFYELLSQKKDKKLNWNKKKNLKLL